MSSHRHVAQIVTACAVAALATACGSGGNSTGNSSTGAAATITTNWETFFDASTPVAKRATLLQDGSMFPTSVLAATGLAAHAKAQVLAITNVTSTQAKVKYNILIAGTPALKNEMGIAVHQDGTWKVGVASFCSLLTLENGNKTSGLPAPCKSAG